jgi:hypothetical protein
VYARKNDERRDKVCVSKCYMYLLTERGGMRWKREYSEGNVMILEEKER